MPLRLWESCWQVWLSRSSYSHNMAKYEGFFRCDLCNGKFDRSEQVRNDIAIVNGTWGKVFGDVCDPCIKKAANLIDKEFPSNRSLLKKEESLIPRFVGQIAK